MTLCFEKLHVATTHALRKGLVFVSIYGSFCETAGRVHVSHQAYCTEANVSLRRPALTAACTWLSATFTNAVVASGSRVGCWCRGAFSSSVSVRWSQTPQCGPPRCVEPLEWSIILLVSLEMT